MATTSDTVPLDKIKQLIAEPNQKIRLFDYVKEKSDVLATQITEEYFPLNVPWDSTELATRLEKYENLSSELISIFSLIGYWGTTDHLPVISIPMKVFLLSNGNDPRRNNWSSLRWYPMLLITYAIGIGAIANKNYPVLYGYFQPNYRNQSHLSNRMRFSLVLEEGLESSRQFFKSLPGHEKQHFPLNEYLFDLFGKKWNDVLFLGLDYEDIFDRFEIFYALQFAHDRERTSGHVWGPPGRFGWKYSNRSDSDPFRLLSEEASIHKESWAPLRAGFFDGSYERFDMLAKQIERIIGSIH